MAGEFDNDWHGETQMDVDGVLPRQARRSMDFYTERTKLLQPELV
ncbi:MAG: hypothetical protein ACKOBW_06325 [Planctomycetota bacterium]